MRGAAHYSYRRLTVYTLLGALLLTAVIANEKQASEEEDEVKRWRHLADITLNDLQRGRCTDLLNVLVRCRQRQDYLAEKGFGKVKRHDWSNLKGYFANMAYGRRR